MVKNLTRLVIANVYLKHQVKCCYNYLEIMKRNNYLDDLTSILQNLKIQNPQYLEIFRRNFTYIFYLKKYVNSNLSI